MEVQRIHFPDGTYTVMQSDRSSISGDVVLDSLNMVYRDEDSNLDQTCEKQIFCTLYYTYKDLKF